MGKLLQILFLLTGICLIPAEGSAQDLKIAVTTDVHGAYFPYDWDSGKPIRGSLAQVSNWATGQRNQPGRELILLDNGDLIQGDPASYYSNFVVPEKPNIAARILNFMQYDGAVVGNHDLEAGHAVYDKLRKEFAFPWMAANAVKDPGDSPWFTPYLILKKAGLKIAVIGLITPKVPDWLPRELWSGMRFEDMIRSARFWVDQVKSRENPDIIVGLFHAGVDPSYGNQDPKKALNENASRLVAEQVAGFNLIFTGHDHRRWNLKVAGPEGDSVLILGSESRAEEIAVATIVRRKGNPQKGGPGIQFTGEHVQMESVDPDPVFMRKFRGYVDSVRSYVSEPVGVILRTVTTEDAWFGPSGFTDLIHRAQLDLTGADISFTAPLSFRAELPAGILKVRDLFKLYRFENQLYTIKLTGKEIQGYLNYSYSLWMKSMKSPDDLMLNMVQQADGTWRFRNASYNFDSAMGIDYVVDLAKPEGSMVTILKLSDGRDFDPSRTYKVAMNSYRASGGGNHLSVGAGLSREEAADRVVEGTPQDFRFLLSGWLKKKGTVDPVAGSNWKVIPESWVEGAISRDRIRLYGK